MSTEINRSEKRRIDRLSKIGDLTDTDFCYFDRVTKIASQLMGTPVSLVSIVKEDKQQFLGKTGDIGKYNRIRETPLSHSFCKHVVETRAFLSVTNARNHSLVRENPIVNELGISAYIGAPIATNDGEMLGSFCAIDTEPHEWTEQQADLIRDFAKIVADYLSVRIEKSSKPVIDEVLMHDIKTPLSAMHLASLVLQENLDKISEKLHPLITSMTTSSEHMKELIGHLDPNSKDLQDDKSDGSNLAKAIERSVARNTVLGEPKRIVIEAAEFDPEIILQIEDWKLERIIDNLLNNAVKFTKNDGVIKIWPQISSSSAGFHVRDCGPGFSETDIENLYRRYSQLSAKPTAGEMSTGLGLSIVKNLVDENRGSVELTQKSGNGAEFLVILPRK